MLTAIIGKPWTKLANVGLGMLLARYYMRVLKYRKTKDDRPVQWV